MSATHDPDPISKAALALTDLRGAVAAASAPGLSVLEDPTGRRRRILAIAGRFATAALVVWLLLLVLGGLGIVPSAWAPLDGALGPPRVAILPHQPTPSPPSRSDASPAAPAAGPAATALGAGTAFSATRGASRRAAGSSPASSRRPSRSSHVTGLIPASSGLGTTVARGNGTATAPAGSKSRGTGSVAANSTRGTSSAATSKTGIAPGKSATPPGTRTATTTTTTVPSSSGSGTGHRPSAVPGSTR